MILRFMAIAEADPTKGEDLLAGDLPTPQTLDEALSILNRLKTMRESLLEEKSRNDKFVQRYQEKVAKAERIATLKQLIPRSLLVRQDRYDQEIEKVLTWENVSDDDIQK